VTHIRQKFSLQSGGFDCDVSGFCELGLEAFPFGNITKYAPGSDGLAIFKVTAAAAFHRYRTALFGHEYRFDMIKFFAGDHSFEHFRAMRKAVGMNDVE
jgi:hypothetical protein